MEIVNVKEYQGGLDQAVDYIHGVWRSAQNYPYYRDAIYHSSLPGRAYHNSIYY